MVIVRVVELPIGVKAIGAKDENGDLNIYTNSRYNQEQQCGGYIHEMIHYSLGHFDDLEKPVLMKEAEVNEYLRSCAK